MGLQIQAHGTLGLRVSLPQFNCNRSSSPASPPAIPSFSTVPEPDLKFNSGATTFAPSEAEGGNFSFSLRSKTAGLLLYVDCLLRHGVIVFPQNFGWSGPTMLQEEEEGVLHFYAFLTPPEHNINRRKFVRIDEANLVDGVDVRIPQLDAVFRDGGRLSFNFRFLPGYCQVCGTLFIVGGMHFKDRYADSDLLLSFNPAAPSPPGDCSTATGLSSWDVAGVMCTGRQRCVAVPYDGKVFVFGGVSGPNIFPEIYDPQSGKFLLPLDYPEDLGLEYPTSYFLWKDSRSPHKKPLIVLYSDCAGEPSQLYSYGVEGNGWELFDNRFPAPPHDFGHWRRSLIPLGCSDNLLVIDYAAHWSIYNLSSKKVVGEVKVPDLNNDQHVVHAFCWRSSD